MSADEKRRMAASREAVRTMFSPGMKLSRLVDDNYMLLPVIERFGMGLGFGDIIVGEACRRAGVSEDFFLTICNIYTYDGYMPDGEALGRMSITELIGYLCSSHEYYSRLQIPRLKEKLDGLVYSCLRSHSALLSRFFDSYEQELANHFAYEDEVVFPYVRELASGSRLGGYSIDKFGENHGNIEEKLEDLKNIILKYLPAGCDEALRTEVLFDLYRLRDDLARHTMLENLVLIPLVSRLEDCAGK